MNRIESMMNNKHHKSCAVSRGKGLSARHVFLTTLAMFLAVLTQMPAQAQLSQREGLRIGGLFGWGPNEQQVQMVGLPGVPSCCPQYDGGTGNNLALGLSFEMPLFARTTFNLRLLYSDYSSVLETKERELVTAEQDTVSATFLHTITTARSALALEGFISYAPVSRLQLIGGVRADYVLASTFHQEERILEPANIRYENDSRTRLVYDDDLPDAASTHIAILAGVRYDLPINNTNSLVLVPEAVLWQGVSDIIENRDWRMRGIRFGLGLQYVLFRESRMSSPLDPSPDVEWPDSQEQSSKNSN